MIFLYLKAPFGAFRTFTSGSFRPTAGFITPSAAYGLLLNVAGIEMRHDDGVSLMTGVAKGLPPVRLSLATLQWPGPARQSLLQQLHNYPVGSTGKEHAPGAKGSKYNIIPVRREFLMDINAYIGVDGNPELEKRILDGLQGKTARLYGVLFLGDNNFLIDRLEPLEQPQPAHWFEKVQEVEERIRKNVMRLTITIDRADLSRSRSMLFAPCPGKRATPTSDSWVEVNYL
ncbi:MAG: type I-MYXAN CRISPR-associated protein Cas5/Cmx5/DevS [Syntrophobacteraceae bacterium]